MATFGDPKDVLKPVGQAAPQPASGPGGSPAVTRLQATSDAAGPGALTVKQRPARMPNKKTLTLTNPITPPATAAE